MTGTRKKYLDICQALEGIVNSGEKRAEDFELEGRAEEARKEREYCELILEALAIVHREMFSMMYKRYVGTACGKVYSTFAANETIAREIIAYMSYEDGRPCKARDVELDDICGEMKRVRGKKDK